MSKHPAPAVVLTQAKLFIRVTGRRNLNNPGVYFGKLVAWRNSTPGCSCVGEALELVLPTLAYEVSHRLMYNYFECRRAHPAITSETFKQEIRDA